MKGGWGGDEQRRKAAKESREAEEKRVQKGEWVGEFFGVEAEVRVPRNHPSLAP